MVVVRKPDDRRVRLGPLEVTLLLEASDGAGFSLVLFDAEPGTTAPPQLHANSREDWSALVLEGELTLSTETGPQTVASCELVFIPRDTPFNWRNAGPGRLRFVAVYSPAGFEQFFPDARAAVDQAGGMPTDPQELGQILMPLWQHYGVQPG